MSDKPTPQGPWIGVLFDISQFDEALYGRAATKLLIEIVGRESLRGCVIHGGDLLPDCIYWCNAIHTASQEQAGFIESSLFESDNEKLAHSRAPVLKDNDVPVDTLTFQGFVSEEADYVGV